MKPFQALFLLILLVPFIEIYLLIQVGEIIGALPTIFLVLFTAALGTYLLRQQGMETFQRLQRSLAQGEIPAYEIVEGPIILLGGILLLTPGFLTDILGFACLLPSLRRSLAQYILEKQFIQASGFYQSRRADTTKILEGEFRKEE